MIFQLITPLPPLTLDWLREEISATRSVDVEGQALRAAVTIAAIDEALARSRRPVVECRSNDSSAVDVNRRARTVTTLVVPWNAPASVPFRGQVWSEVFERGAFDDLRSGGGRTIRCNRSHDERLTVGRVISFDPSDPRGLVAEISIAATPLGDETLALAADDCLSASVAFTVPSGGEQLDQRARLRRITRATIRHVGLVEDPAYSAAAILAVG